MPISASFSPESLSGLHQEAERNLEFRIYNSELKKASRKNREDFFNMPRIEQDRESFHPSQLFDLLKQFTGRRIDVSEGNVREFMILRANVWPTALLQDIALRREWTLSGNRSTPISYYPLLDSATRQLSNPPPRKNMIDFVNEVERETCKTLGDIQEKNFYGQPILPQTKIPIVANLDPFSWTSTHQLQRLDMVGTLVRQIDEEGRKIPHTAEAYERYVTAEGKYRAGILNKMKRMAAALRD